MYNYTYDLPSTYSSTASVPADVSTAIWAALAGVMGLIMFAVAVVVILQIIGMWKIFTKAGEAGWKSLIPFYNIAILYKISGMSPYLVLVYIGLLIPFINFFAGIAIGVFDLYQKINICKAFRKSTGFTVAMIMVPFIANLILAFGDSQYYGLDENNV